VLQPPWQLRQTLFKTLTFPGTSVVASADIFVALNVVSFPGSGGANTSIFRSLTNPSELIDVVRSGNGSLLRAATLGTEFLSPQSMAQRRKWGVPRQAPRFVTTSTPTQIQADPARQRGISVGPGACTKTQGQSLLITTTFSGQARKRIAGSKLKVGKVETLNFQL
jgi:hypothetical protein